MSISAGTPGQSLKSLIAKFEPSNYAYVTARVRGKKRNLLTSDVYPKLMKMGPSQIARLLSEGAYNREMTELATKYSGTELVERALNLNLARTYREILGYSRGRLHWKLEAYLDWWNVYNIKIILRGIHHHIPDKEIREHLIPAGSFDMDFLENLLDCDTAEETLATLSSNGYRVPPPEDVCIINDEKCKLRPIEDFYDRTYYENLIISAQGRSKPDRIYMGFVKRSIDVVNAKNLMEMLQDGGVDTNNIRNYMLQGGEALAVESLCEAAEKGKDQALKLIKEKLGTDLGSVDGASANIVAIQLDKYMMELASKLSYIYPLSIIPIVDFLIRKEKETKFLRIIVKGKENSLPEEKIRRMLPI